MSRFPVITAPAGRLLSSLCQHGHPAPRHPLIAAAAITAADGTVLTLIRGMPSPATQAGSTITAASPPIASSPCDSCRPHGFVLLRHHHLACRSVRTQPYPALCSPSPCNATLRATRRRRHGHGHSLRSPSPRCDTITPARCMVLAGQHCRHTTEGGHGRRHGGDAGEAGWPRCD